MAGQLCVRRNRKPLIVSRLIVNKVRTIVLAQNSLRERQNGEKFMNELFVIVLQLCVVLLFLRINIKNYRIIKINDGPI